MLAARRGALRGLGATALLALSWLVTPDARAEDLETLLAQIEGSVTNLARKSESLERQAAPGRGVISESDAMRRFEECLYEFMLGHYEPAAEGFFALVTTGALADAGLHRDAEWYLAEALFKMGNWGTAEQRFRVVANDGQHPFHDDAVRRLLELYATSGQTEKFYAEYEQQIVRGQVRPSDLVTYSIGKNFFQQGDYVKAKSQLAEIPSTSPYYNKSRYVLGAIMVQEGDLEQARQYFTDVTGVSVRTTEDREVLDLALLALGRINYELGDFLAAEDAYSQIGGDSQYLADKLYEIVWTYIKQNEYQQALRAVEIFMLAFPEHQYTAQLKLVQGQLHMTEVEYDAALSSYQSVIADYTPIEKRFGELASSDAGASAFFRQIAQVQEGTVATSEVTVELPAYALSMMTADPDLSRALTVYREIERQEKTVSESEAIIAQLQEALGGEGGLGSYTNARDDAAVLHNTVLQQNLELMRVEENWLRDVSPQSARGELDRLRNQRTALLDAVMKPDSLHGTDMWPQVRDLRTAYRSARGSADAANAERVSARIDGLYTSLDAADARLRKVLGSLASSESGEIVRIRERFEYEVGEVGKQRADLVNTRTSAEQVASAMTRAGFGRLHAFFSDSVLQADMGIVDVYWQQKLEVADERQQMVERKNELLAELENRFNLIRQELPPAPRPNASASAATKEESTP